MDNDRIFSGAAMSEFEAGYAFDDLIIKYPYDDKKYNYIDEAILLEFGQVLAEYSHEKETLILASRYGFNELAVLRWMRANGFRWFWIKFPLKKDCPELTPICVAKWKAKQIKKHKLKIFYEGDSLQYNYLKHFAKDCQILWVTTPEEFISRRWNL